MADKKLLEESTIRRFMKLANIDSVGTGSVLTEGNVTTPFKGSADPRKGSKKHLARKKMHETLEEMEGTSVYEEADEMGGMDMDAGLDAGAGDELGGMEGGDETSEIESAVDSIIASLNTVLEKSGSSKKVEQEPAEEDIGGEESEEPPAEEDEEGLEEAWLEEEESLKERRHKKEMEEESLEERRHKGKKDHKKEMEEESLEESIELVDDSLVEKLLQRVTARLVKEAKGYSGHGAGVKQGAPFNKSASHSSKNTKAVNARKGTKSVNNRKR